MPILLDLDPDRARQVSYRALLIIWAITLVLNGGAIVVQLRAGNVDSAALHHVALLVTIALGWAAQMHHAKSEADLQNTRRLSARLENEIALSRAVLDAVMAAPSIALSLSLTPETKH